MGLSWQQGPLAADTIGTLLSAEPVPARLLYAEPLRRRMRVEFGGQVIAVSDDVVVLHEPGRYPVAYFPLRDVAAGALELSDRVTDHRDLGATAWYAVRAGERETRRAAWQHTALPEHAQVLGDRVAFAWRAMDAFYEEDERILGHAADAYHRVDVRTTSRHLTVQAAGRQIAESRRPLVLYESGFAPRWYVPREDVESDALTAVPRQTFCPYKGFCDHFDVGDSSRAAWSYTNPYHEADRIAGCVSFEPDKVMVTIDGQQLHAEPGQHVVAHGADRDLSAEQSAPGAESAARAVTGRA